MVDVDVCVIGGGMAGASVAYSLAPRARVLLLEREPQVGYHSTGRSAALYSPQYGSLMIRRLTAATGPFLSSPPEGFASAPLLTPRGFMTIGTDEDLDELAMLEELARATDSPLHRLTPAEVHARVPVIRPGAIGWGALDPGAMDMDVDALLQGFLRGARAHHARIATGEEVMSLERSEGGWEIHTSTMRIRSGVVVNAAGAWADAIAGLASVTPLGLVPYRRTAFNFDAPPPANPSTWPMIIDARERFYLKPDAGRVLGSLAEEQASEPCDAQPDDLDVATAVDRIEQVIDFPINRVIRSWTGLRTFAPDRDPVSGFDASAPGFYWHAAIGGYGIQTAAALGRHAAARILGESLPEDLAAVGLVATDLDPSRLR
jgi:D-arginine dehydrogenase